jgi:hypothetical protein
VSQLPLTLTIPIVALVIPGAIFMGQLWRNGALVICGACALLAFLTLWTLGATAAVSGGNPPLNSQADTIYTVIYTFLGADLLLFAGWALALASAVNQRRWGWVMALIASVFVSLALFTYAEQATNGACSAYASQPCFLGLPLAYLYFLVASVSGPTAILAYALVAPQPQRPRALPAGLSTSPILTPED